MNGQVLAQIILCIFCILYGKNDIVISLIISIFYLFWSLTLLEHNLECLCRRRENECVLGRKGIGENVKKIYSSPSTSVCYMSIISILLKKGNENNCSLKFMSQISFSFFVLTSIPLYFYYSIFKN